MCTMTCKDMKPSAPPRECRICCAPLDSEDVVSEVYGARVCKECAMVERRGFAWCAIGLVAIGVFWIMAQVLYRKGIVGSAFKAWASLIWGPIWVTLCLLTIYIRLNRRKQCRRG